MCGHCQLPSRWGRRLLCSISSSADMLCTGKWQPLSQTAFLAVHDSDATNKTPQKMDNRSTAQLLNFIANSLNAVFNLQQHNFHALMNIIHHACWTVRNRYKRKRHFPSYWSVIITADIDYKRQDQYTNWKSRKMDQRRSTWRYSWRNRSHQVQTCMRTCRHAEACLTMPKKVARQQKLPQCTDEQSTHLNTA